MKKQEKFSRSLRKLAKKEAKRLSCETDITLAAAHELLRSACPPLPTVTLPLPLSRDELAEDGFVTHDEAMDAQAYSRKAAYPAFAVGYFILACSPFSVRI